MEYIVKIDATDLDSTDPSDGFIDPRTVIDYWTETHWISSKNVSGLAENQMFILNDVPITLAGNNGAAVVTAINDKSAQHHFFAIFANNKLTLKPLPYYSNIIPQITDITAGMADNLGFVTPVQDNTPALPTNKDAAIAKSRANWRWSMILESLQKTSNLNEVYFLKNPVGATVDDSATEIEFVIDVPDSYYNFDEHGAVIDGEEAITYAIAHALMTGVSDKLEIYYDPTTYVSPLDSNNSIPYNLRMEKIEIGALTNDFEKAYDAITVTLK